MSLPQTSLRVGVLQLTSVEDVDKNLKQVKRLLKRLKGKGLDLICLPENAFFMRLNRESNHGFGFDLTEGFWSELQDWVRDENCEIWVGSVPYKEKGFVSNATIRITPHSVAAVYRKIHLFDVQVKGSPPVRESDYFRHGEEPQILKIKGWDVGLTICYDLRFSELYLKYAQSGVHLILVPSAFLVPTGRAHWHVLLRARAIESQAFVIAAAQSGRHRSGHVTRETYGHSLAVAPWGRILREAKKRGPSAFVVDLDPKLIAQARTQIPMAEHRRL